MHDTDQSLQALVQQLQSDHYLGILLAAQMGGTPEEIQLFVQIAAYDEQKDAITPQVVYAVRCLGVREQRLSLGLFNTIVHVDQDNALLWNHNFTYQQVYFRGQVEAVDSLMLELNQLYGKHYGPFRSLADDINRALPLERLLSSGHGLVGEMPSPMAERVQQLFARYDLQTTIVAAEQDTPPVQFQLLVMDDSFLIAQRFSVEQMQGKHGI
jgi:hypothetical protein